MTSWPWTLMVNGISSLKPKACTFVFCQFTSSPRDAASLAIVFNMGTKSSSIKSLNIIKSFLVISSMRNETGLNLGWVFAGFFLGGFTPKNPPGFFGGIYLGFWTLFGALGVTILSDLPLDKHIANVCLSSFYSLYQLRRVRRILIPRHGLHQDARPCFRHVACGLL